MGFFTDIFNVDTSTTIETYTENALQPCMFNGGAVELSPEALEGLVNEFAEETMRDEWLGEMGDILVCEAYADAIDCQRLERQAREASDAAEALAASIHKFSNRQTSDALTDAAADLWVDAADWANEADKNWARMSTLSQYSQDLQPTRYKEGYELPTLQGWERS
tara:strand:- start:767 stop:1261 length:495 start_codon:yes stop_codon:yes gene_type:complete